MATVAPTIRDVATERATIDAHIAGRTLLDAFAQTVEQLGDTEAIKWKADGAWQALTWREYRSVVADVALGLAALGFEPGQFGLVLSRNRPEAMIADLGIQHARGVPVVLYNSLAPEQAAYIANHCQASVAFVENRQFLRMFEAFAEQLPHLRLVILTEDDEQPRAGAGWTTTTWQALVEAGQKANVHAPQLFEQTWRQVRPEDLAALVYTSGTTGRPKGVMITQRNVLWEAAAVNQMAPPRDGERTISYLPLAHVTGRWLDVWSRAINGGTVHCCPDPTQLLAYALEARPTNMVGVPRVWEKLHAGMTLGIAAEADPARKRAVEWAIDIGRQVVRLRQQGLEVPAALADQAEQAAPICKAVLARVGLDHCAAAATGAAPIDPAIIEFFQALGLPLIEAWGMSELTCAATGNPSDAPRNGTIGVAAAGVEVRLADDGEILVRAGCQTPGYYNDPAATAEALDAEGWLHTGDLATVDADGYYRIIGRKKELIITAGGKNIAPSAIENLLQQHQLIGQACAVGDRKPYINALLVLDPAGAQAWARAHDLRGSSTAELAREPAILDEVQRAVDAANVHLARAEQVKRFALLPNEWTAQTGELTPTLKKRRSVILERYAAEIAALYAEPAVAPAAPR